ncbi:hypothetical protein ACSSS7_008355 [Eimeria intestinalis]
MVGGVGVAPTRNGTAATKPAAAAAKAATTTATTAATAATAAAAAADGDDLKFTSLLGVLIAFPTPEEEEAFDPLASELPPALLPVNGVPLLEYGIESMKRNGVTELYVLVRDDTGGHAVREVVVKQQQREQQQQQQRYSSSSKHPPLRIHCILLPSTVKTVGDALRDFDSRVDVRSSKHHHHQHQHHHHHQHQHQHQQH